MVKNTKEMLRKYLNSQNLMSLATHTEDNKLWICSVYYAIDNDFNFYFVSKPFRDHIKGIMKNPEVACSIADSTQKVTVKKIGVQVQGKAYPLNNLQKMKLMLALWSKMNPGVENVINFNNIKNNVIATRAYQVKPSLIKFFNEEYYKEKEFEIFRF